MLASPATLPAQSTDTLVDRTADSSRRASEALVQAQGGDDLSLQLRADVDGPVVSSPPSSLIATTRPDARADSDPARPSDTSRSPSYINDAPIGQTAVEVRAGQSWSTKHEYRQMLRDISDFAVGRDLSGLSALRGSFQARRRRSAELLYRRFAVLNARLNDPEFRAAVGFVLGRPHNDWVHEAEWRSPSMPLRGGPELRRALATGRPRRDWPDAPPGLATHDAPDVRLRYGGTRSPLTPSPIVS